MHTPLATLTKGAEAECVITLWLADARLTFSRQLIRRLRRKSSSFVAHPTLRKKIKKTICLLLQCLFLLNQVVVFLDNQIMDTLSITASVITVAALAYDGSRTIYDLIKGYKGASKTLEDLETDVEGLNGVLLSLTSIGGTDRGASLSQAQLLCLKEAERKPSLL
ncbi:hypothetical protein RRF57_010044 [Xylaria bambusicola]|uniref:Azaphilone pigments biosynthesis cluster protein L N-terminal domain-containing protein n=1 Tax=Xylaria bambusicola TaxID=326684 RepID=A0AAN7UKL8_9PEZI